MRAFHMVFHFRALGRREAELGRGDGRVLPQVLQFHGIGVAVEVHDLRPADERGGRVYPYLGFGHLRGRLLGIEQKVDEAVLRRGFGGFNVEVAGEGALPPF